MFYQLRVKEGVLRALMGNFMICSEFEGLFVVEHWLRVLLLVGLSFRFFVRQGVRHKFRNRRALFYRVLLVHGVMFVFYRLQFRLRRVQSTFLTRFVRTLRLDRRPLTFIRFLTYCPGTYLDVNDVRVFLRRIGNAIILSLLRHHD